MEMAMEDPDSEAVMERERQKAANHDNWKDFVPKGRGVTQRIWTIQQQNKCVLILILII